MENFCILMGDCCWTGRANPSTSSLVVQTGNTFQPRPDAVVMNTSLMIRYGCLGRLGCAPRRAAFQGEIDRRDNEKGQQCCRNKSPGHDGCKVALHVAADAG